MDRPNKGDKVKRTWSVGDEVHTATGIVASVYSHHAVSVEGTQLWEEDSNSLYELVEAAPREEVRISACRDIDNELWVHLKNGWGYVGGATLQKNLPMEYAPYTLVTVVGDEQ